MSITPLPGPHGLYDVSVMPRFLLDSARVGWQGAYFTDILAASEGTVDHVHPRYCVKRSTRREAHRLTGRRTWQDLPAGVLVRHPGDEDRLQWRDGGRAQFLFIAPEQVAQVLGDDRPLARPAHDKPQALQGHGQPGPSPVVELIFDALQADLAQGSPAGPLVGESLIAALVAHLAGQAGLAGQGGQLSAQGRANGPLSARAHARVVDLVEARLAEPVTLQDMADAAGLGVRQFTQAFRAATGWSPHQYMLQRRVDQAQRLIRQGLPLADVALQCGFCDQSQLSRTFARLVGTTPGRYRAGSSGRVHLVA